MKQLSKQQLRQRLHELRRARRNIRRQAAQWNHEADVLRRKASELLATDALLADEEQALAQYLEGREQCHA